MKFFFTSDCHFGHKNIIEYCKRPFDSLTHMHKELINNWRNTVAPEDTVFHMGDFSFLNREETDSIIRVLTGRIVFLRGNHERYPKTIIDTVVVKYEGHSIHLNHYPERANPLMLSVCGHIHEKWIVQYHPIIPIYKDELQRRKGFPIVNVGVDVWGYKPVELTEVLRYCKE